MKTCNQCGEEMRCMVLIDIDEEDLKYASTGSQDLAHFLMSNWFACTNPECPNHALLQVSMEDMPKEEE